MKFSISCILFLISLSTFAASTETGKLFEQGINYFKKNDYKNARHYFNLAAQQDLNIAALHYNLGVTHFKLADYAMAEKHFLLTSKFPQMAPLAYYNLALVKQQQHNNKQARNWFQKAYDTTNNKKIKSLSLAQLKKFEKSVVDNWYNYVFAHAGYNDNVTLDNDAITIASNQADSFVELFAYTRGLVSGTRKDGILFKARLYSDIYTSLSDYNLTELNAGLYKTYPLAGWNTESGMYFNYSTQGGRGYLQSTNLTFTGKKSLSPKTKLRLRVRAHQINAIDPIYDPLTGRALDIRLESRWIFTTNNRVRAYYQYDNNKREDFSSATRFTSRSPIRHRFRLDYYFPLTRHWKSQLSAEYRYSPYTGNNTNSTTGLNQQRIDERLRGKVAIRRALSKQLYLNFEYAFTQNTSSIKLYEYTQNIILGGIQYSF